MKNFYLCHELIINLLYLSKMKKVILSVIAIAALTVVSCKKEAENTEAAADTTAVAPEAPADTTAAPAADTTAAAADTTAAPAEAAKK
ncbi:MULTISPECIES: hypothetical protein [unclassified Flavobacterium]|uniref:hypothetical protein n=1 Tax=unclassified Flavobacterium TaxID=196869 RepID=UPI001F137608|nr:MULTISPECIES: hypothetical protein [unclassified Flavobacterium]UMY66752.1 hypothetical protein MKO97_05030 [Flavobacterium sp. HJ-32-4]